LRRSLNTSLIDASQRRGFGARSASFAKGSDGDSLSSPSCSVFGVSLENIEPVGVNIRQRLAFRRRTCLRVSRSGILLQQLNCLYCNFFLVLLFHWL